ncbi:MAG: phage terminase large subunit [Pseudomonadota bacterium]
MTKLFPRQVEVTETTLAKGARYTLIYGGARSGKTALLCYATACRAVAAPGSRHLFLRKFAKSARISLAKDTFEFVMRTMLPGVPFKGHGGRNLDYYTIDLGETGQSEVWVLGIDDADRFDKVLGMEFATIYVNEASEIPYDVYSDLDSRLAQMTPCPASPGGVLPQRMYVDLNPTSRNHWTYKLFVEGIDPETTAPIRDRSKYAADKMHPEDNPHLGKDFLEAQASKGPRHRKRFFEGEYAEDVDGALWSRDMIEYSSTGEQPPNLRRVVVAIDPAISSKPQADEHGIIAAGIDDGGVVWILDDASMRGHPADAAREAIGLYHSYDADALVVEGNQGGEWVTSLIRTADIGGPPESHGTINIKQVGATVGKRLRAEPVSGLYRRRRVKHVFPFPQLEDQMCAIKSDFEPRSEGWSPDRVDAMVWAVTDLLKLAQRSDRVSTRRPRPGQYRKARVW